MSLRGAATTSIAEARPRGTVDYSRFQGLLADLSRAITERRVCRATYHAPYHAEPKTCWVAPLKIIAHNDTLYLKCRLAWEDERGPEGRSHGTTSPPPSTIPPRHPGMDSRKPA